MLEAALNNASATDLDVGRVALAIDDDGHPSFSDPEDIRIYQDFYDYLSSEASDDYVNELDDDNARFEQSEPPPLALAGTSPPIAYRSCSSSCSWASRQLVIPDFRRS